MSAGHDGGHAPKPPLRAAHDGGHAPKPPLRAAHDGGHAPKPPLKAAHDGGHAPKPPLKADVDGGYAPKPSLRVAHFVAPLAVLCIAGWWGCASGGDATTQASIASSSSGSNPSTSSVGGGSVGTGGAAANGGAGGAGGTGGDAGMCSPTSTPAVHVPLDIVFAVDQSSAMEGENWNFVTSALPKFFQDPLSAGIGAGLVLFPYSAYDCDLDHYKVLTAPVGVLPANATALTSALPTSAIGVGLPLYPALQGALMQATALKDANPTHAVIVVLATGGLPNSCDTDIDDLAALSASALSYDGVLTYVIALPGSAAYLLNDVAAAGGTSAAHDLTADVGPLASTLAQIRTAGLGCSYTIPKPSNGQPLNPDEVNFSYTPKGMPPAITLLRATDAAGCNGQPGWYYDDAKAPTKIVLCPESCATVQADPSPELDVLLGCKSQLE